MNPADKAVAGAALAPLTNEQKTGLILLARQAYGTTHPTQSTTHEVLSFDDWRRQQVLFAVERPGLTACRNEDYLPLRAHFLRLLGRTGAAEIAAARVWEDPRRQALAKLQHECRTAQDVMPAAWNYAAGFIRNKRNVSIDDADARTIWHAVFLVRRRAAQLRRKGGRL
jgi:hypothetical protein